MNKAETVSRQYGFAVAALGLWLAIWIVMSWAAIQDDALIHLRYADNLYLHHFITYDGRHANYGASSLLYVGLLAILRGVTASPELPRAVSSGVHLLLFTGLSIALWRWSLSQVRIARVAGLLLLVLLVTPSAVRWLDDGMETGLAVSMALTLAWMIHAGAGSPRRGLMLGLLAFLAVMLRTELLLLCAVGTAILMLERIELRQGSGSSLRNVKAGQQGSTGLVAIAALAGGAMTAVGVIFATMRVLLPDTALAKSHGIAHWFNPIHDTAVTMAGAFSFGAGMFAFWLLTLGLVAMRARLTLQTALANCLCPAVLALSSLRGQEIQGVRYFAWTFAFSIMWNIREFAETNDEMVRWSLRDGRGVILLYVFAGLFAVELPVECVAMHRVLTQRGETMRAFQSQHLEVLRGRRGVASDIGYIGYFTGADICDLAGLVNGREAARLSSKERVYACAGTKPEFMFLNRSQFGSMAAATAMDDWKVCGQYDFANVRTADKHYLIVRPEIAEEVCRATGSQSETVAAVFTTEPKLVAQRAGN